MKLFVVTKNGVVHGEAFKSLRGACGASGINYSSATHGKRSRFEYDTNTVWIITEVEVVKIKGRGNPGFG